MNNSYRTKQLIALITLASAASLATLPAWSDSTTNISTTTKKSHWTSMPKSMIGFCAGVVVGTPICFVRKLPQETKEGAFGLAQSFKADTKNKLLVYPCGAVWLPAAAFVTALEAPGYAFKEAYLAEKPFSQEQFSLGTLDKPKQALEHANEQGQPNEQK